MKFMMLIKANQNTEAGVMPEQSLISAMMQYNEEMVKAGVLLAGDGLHPSSKGARIQFNGSKRTVVDGPFAETKELIAGFWMIQVQSKEEAVEWALRCPDPLGPGEYAEIELRQVFEASDFGPALTPELKEAEERLREQVSTLRQ